MKKVGVVGLGAMGGPMAKNLLKAGFPLFVFDINKAAVEDLVNDGAIPANSGKEAAQNCEVVITILPACAHVKAAVLGPEGILEGMSQGKTLIDMSSIAPTTTKMLAEEAAIIGVKMIDAPVSGGTVGAEKGTLTIMVGGPKEVMEEHLDVLQAMGQNIKHLGPIGMGEAVKMVNQILVGVNMLALAEAFVLGVKAGADPEVMFEVIRTSAGNSFMADSRLPHYVFPGDFEKPGFALDLLKKDLGLAVDTAKELNVPVPATSLAYQLYTAVSSVGRGKLDSSAIFTLFEDLAGVKVRK